MTDRTIYKIVSESEWLAAEKDRRFTGSTLDRQDGYIHFSTIKQVRETAAKHFAKQSGLVLVAIDAERLGAKLKWEPSRGGALFPHLYDALTLDNVKWKAPLPLDEKGLHIFPALDGDNA